MKELEIRLMSCVCVGVMVFLGIVSFMVVK